MKDIVDELREIKRMNTTLHGAQMAARVADEIERLRAELGTRIAMCDMRSERVIEVTSERDAARREVCGWAARHFNEYAEHIARERGWDCYDSVFANEIKILRDKSNK